MSAENVHVMEEAGSIGPSAVARTDDGDGTVTGTGNGAERPAANDAIAAAEPAAGAEVEANPVLEACRALFPTLEIDGVRHRLPGIIACTARFPGADMATTFQVHLLDPSATQHRDETEFEALPAATSDPRLPTIREFAVVQGHPCFSVEHREGESLRTLLLADALPPRRALEIGIGVCRVLEALHASGMRHFCLAPEFVFVGSEDAPIVELAGLIPLVSGSAADRQRFAAQVPARLRPYLAPEYSAAQGLPDQRADIFSLGVLLYELLMGRPPSGFFALPSLRAGLSRRIDSIIATCLQKDPEHRFPGVAAVREELERVGESDHASFDGRLDDPADGENATSRQPAWTETHSVGAGRLWIKVAGAVMAAVVLGTGTYLYFTGAFTSGGMLPAFSPVETLLADARRAINAGEYEKALELVRQVLRKADAAPDILAPAMEILEQTGLYPRAIGVLDEKLATLEESDPWRSHLQDTRDQFAGRVAAYVAAMSAAMRALDAGDDQAERDALGKALATMPHDREAAAKLRVNPIAIRENVEAVLRGIAEDQPGFEPSTAIVTVRRGGADLDLSGATALTDLAPLRGLPLEALDISETGVVDLSPLSGMLLRRLWCDDTPLASLEGIAGLPLELLSFDGTSVPPEGIDVVDRFGALTTLRHAAGGTPVCRLPRAQAGHPWENSLGMRFIPLGNTHQLIAVHESRVRDFATFRRESGLSADPVQLEVADAEGVEWSDAGLAWDDPVLAPGLRFAARGMTATEAEAFCVWLTERESAAGFIPEGARYRLPTDEEWSIAAGIEPWPLHTPIARTTLGFPAMPWSDNLWPPPVPESAWNDVPVNRSRALNTGVLGLAGNVVEWTSSHPSPVATEYRIARGCAIHGIPTSDLAATRLDLRLRQALPDDHRSNALGFRVVLDLDPDNDPELAPDEGIGALLSVLAEADWDGVRRHAEKLEGEAASPDERQVARAALELARIAHSFRERRRLPVTLDGALPTMGARRYYLCRIPLDWETAKATALAVGGHLVTLTDPRETEFVEQALLRGGSPFGIWLGAEARHSPTGPVWRWQAGGSDNLPPTPPPSSEARLILAPVFSPTGQTESPWEESREWIPADAEQRLWFVIEWG